MEPDIIITDDDLKNPNIDDVINLEKKLSFASEGEDIESVPTPLYLNPVFYYSAAACVGALIVWALTEPYFNDNEMSGIPLLSDYLLFGPVAAVIGLFIGMAYGASNRNLGKMFYCGLVGMGVGLGATILTTFIAEQVYGLLLGIAIGMSGGVENIPQDEYPFKGILFFVLVCARGMGWALVSMGAGLGLGVSLKSKKLVFNGLVGGMIGGLLGGFLFDPIHRFLCSDMHNAALSRAVGIGSVGLLVGFFIGLIENASKEAWFLMQKGPLTGKQFILFRSPTIIGSSPKADIYLFKDAEIDPKHAEIIKSGNKYVIKDMNTGSGVFVNGRRIDRTILQSGDIVTMGETVLKYLEKNK